jgi:CBS domain-containing protein
LKEESKFYFGFREELNYPSEIQHPKSKMSNVIVNRVKEFLKRYPPFTFLSEDSLELVAQGVEVRFYGQQEYLFEQGEQAQNFFFILKEGSVHLLERKDDQDRIMEVCDEGDVFGVLALLGKRPYILSALVQEDSLIYAVPVAIFEKILQENNRVALYFAAGFASGQVVVRSDLSQSQKARSLIKGISEDNGLLIFTGQSDLTYSVQVLTCLKGTLVKEAAALMAESDVGSIVIVNEKNHPLGIITDKDLRNRLLARSKSYDTPVDELMTSPVQTKSKDASFPDLYLTMIKNRLHHLIFTEDGTPFSPVTGILSDHDILLSQGNSPAVLINALLNTWDVSEMAKLRDRAEKLLAYYLENEVAMDFVANIISEINDIIIKRAVEIAKKKHDGNFPEASKVKFCFLSLGSEGREEQLLRTDLDNAIVFEDLAESKIKVTQDYMLLIAQEVIEILLACGFEACPAEIMANNRKYCQPVSEWKKLFSDWIHSPNQQALMNATIFFDFRPIIGSKALSEELTEHIYNEISGKTIFLNFLAKNALLNPAPLGFFRNFIVEKSGEQKDKFDIKLRAMMPLADIARLLVLSHQVVGINNTFKRFEKLSELETNYRELMLEAGKAYEILMRMRAIEGLCEGNSGRYIQPAKLGKIQRQLLKNTFAPIDELQKIIRVRFQLDYFGS